MEKVGGFSRRPSGASDSMVASENRSVTSEKKGAGSNLRSSDSR